MDNSKLSIATLGKLQIHINDTPLADFSSVKAQAVLVYLALQKHPVSRSRLAGLLWGDMPEEMARANLRLVLNKLNKVFAPFLNVSRSEIALECAAAGSTIWTDISVFADGIRQAETLNLAELKALLALYRGAFLYDFSVRDAPEFELWMVETREHLQAQAFHGFLVAAHRAGSAADFPTGIHMARQATALDPYNEEAHRTLMLMLAQGGQRAAALQHYEACQYLLLDELGIEPAPETTQLYEKIRMGEIGIQQTLRIQPAEPVDADTPLPPPLRIMPNPITPLIGRTEEINTLHALLERPDCRLITLFGLGGIGKTRLAIDVGRKYASSHLQRSVVFVALVGYPAHQNASSEEQADLLASSIAEALGLACPVAQNLQEEVLARLAQQNLLLILDNFEELQGAASWVSRILESALQVTLMITSQVRLGIRGEWIIQLQGLPLLESIQLFVKAAEPIQSVLDTGANQAILQRICELVDGSPLAIELASQWVRTLTLSDIAQRLSQNLDLLQTSTEIVPERQQNMRTVFEYTWRMLGTTEQTAFAKLSVFRGGFDLTTGARVAGATPAILNVLLERTLIRREAGRYYLHELMRQFCAEKLLGASDTDAVQQQMFSFYTEFLQKRIYVFTDELQYEIEHASVIEAIDREVENLRAALEWQLDHAAPDLDKLMPFLDVFWAYLQRKGWYGEALTWLTRIVEKTDQQRQGNAFQRAWLAQRIGIANYEMGYTTKSLAHFREALDWLDCSTPTTSFGWYRLALAEILQQVRHRLQLRKLPKRDRSYADEAATSYYYLARIYFLSNTLLPYLVCTIRCINLAESGGSTTNLSGYYAALALLVGGLGLQRLATHYTELARQALPTNRTWRAQASTFEEFGLYAFLRGRWAEAQIFLMDAVRFYEQANLTRYAGEDLALAANACFYQAKVTDAQQVYMQFLHKRGSLSDPRALVWGPMMVCQGALRLGNFPIEEIIQNLVDFEQEHYHYLTIQDAIRLHALLATAYLRDKQYIASEQHVVRGLNLALRERALTMYLTGGLGTLTEICLSLCEANPHRQSLAALSKLACRRLKSLVHNFPGAHVQWLLCEGMWEWLLEHQHAALQRWQSGLRDAENLLMPYEQARFCLELGRHTNDPVAADTFFKRCCDLCLTYGFAYELSIARALRTQNRLNLSYLPQASAI